MVSIKELYEMQCKLALQENSIIISDNKKTNKKVLSKTIKDLFESQIEDNIVPDEDETNTVLRPVQKFTVTPRIFNVTTHKSILQNMISRMTSTGGSKQLLLSGEPGTGKTSFVKQFCRLLGMDYIILEVPHIIEEHLINIPFLYFDSATNTETHHEPKIDNSDSTDRINAKLVKARSVLHQRLVSGKQSSDEQLLRFIYNEAPKNYINLWESLGGNNTTIPSLIAMVRKKFNIILFIDEFYRSTTMTIRNILRDIMGGNLGDNKLPNHAYVIYASNTYDKGIDSMPANYELKEIEHNLPDKEEWFSYLVSNIESQKRVKVNQDVIDFFYTYIDPEDLSSTHTGTSGDDIRVSPRRWEEIIQYVNANIPCESEKEANALYTIVMNNFYDLADNNVHPLHNKFSIAFKHFIKEHTGHVAKNSSITDWGDLLLHQIATKQKLGEARNYVPVLCGPPGIGKTLTMSKIADKLNMLYIHINCSTIKQDDLTGIPIPNKQDNEILIDFTEPAIIALIKKKIKDATLELEKNNVDHKLHDEFKYLVVFDEFNRVLDAKAQNALRRLILDKKLGDRLEDALPEGSVVVAAMNPIDNNNPASIAKLSSHMKDVIDQIPAHNTWDITVSHCMKVAELDIEELEKQLDQPEKYKKEKLTIVKKFLNTFPSYYERASYTKPYDINDIMQDIGHNENPEDFKQYYLRISNTNVYFSPRRYATICSEIISSITFTLLDFNNNINQDNIDEFVNKLDKAISNAINGDVRDIFTRNEGMNYGDVESRKNAENFVQINFEVYISEQLKPSEAFTVIEVDSNSLHGILHDYIIYPPSKTKHLAETPAFQDYFTKLVEEGNTSKFLTELYEVMKNYAKNTFDNFMYGKWDDPMLNNCAVMFEKHYDPESKQIVVTDLEYPISFSNYLMDELLAALEYDNDKIDDEHYKLFHQAVAPLADDADNSIERLYSKIYDDDHTVDERYKAKLIYEFEKIIPLKDAINMDYDELVKLFPDDGSKNIFVYPKDNLQSRSFYESEEDTHVIEFDARKFIKSLDWMDDKTAKQYFGNKSSLLVMLLTHTDNNYAAITKKYRGKSNHVKSSIDLNKESIESGNYLMGDHLKALQDHRGRLYNDIIDDIKLKEKQ